MDIYIPFPCRQKLSVEEREEMDSWRVPAMPTICIPWVAIQVNLSQEHHPTPRQASPQMPADVHGGKAHKTETPQCLQPRESLSHGPCPIFSQISSVLTALLTNMPLTSWHLSQVRKAWGLCLGTCKCCLLLEKCG